MNKKALLGIVSVLVLGVVGFFAWRYHKAHEVPVAKYVTAPVTRRDVLAKVTATGTLAATVTVTVGTQVSGRVDSLHADFNSTVKKGELIATIDPLLFQAAVEQAQANMVSAKANLTKAQATSLDADRQYARQLELGKNNLAAQQDIDSAQTAAAVAKAGIDVARASLAQAQASLNQAQVNLSYTKIVSPIDGVVISRSVDVGQTVASSLSAPTIFTIAQDLRKMQVNTNVSEGDVGRLEQGMPVTFTVDAFPGEKFVGKLNQIRNAATTVSNVVTYDALIDVDNSQLKLRPGMTANATIISAQETNVLTVPNAALRFKPPATAAVASASSHHHHDGGVPMTDAGVPMRLADGGVDRAIHIRDFSFDAGAGDAGAGDGGLEDNPFSVKAVVTAASRKVVYVVVDNELQAVNVVVGLSDGSYTEILHGHLKEGDMVVTDTTDAGDKGGSTTTKPATTKPPSLNGMGGGGGGGGHGGGGR